MYRIKNTFQCFGMENVYEQNFKIAYVIILCGYLRIAQSFVRSLAHLDSRSDDDDDDNRYSRTKHTLYTHWKCTCNFVFDVKIIN